MTIPQVSGHGYSNNHAENWSEFFFQAACTLGCAVSAYAIAKYMSKSPSTEKIASDMRDQPKAITERLPDLEPLAPETLAIDPSEILGDIDQQHHLARFFSAQTYKQIKFPPIDLNDPALLFKRLRHYSKTFDAYSVCGMLSLNMEPIGYLMVLHPTKPESSQLAIPVNALEWLDRTVLTDFLDSESQEPAINTWAAKFGDELFFAYSSAHSLRIFQNRPSYDGFPVVCLHLSYSEGENLQALLERFKALSGTSEQAHNTGHMQKNVNFSVIRRLEKIFASSLTTIANSGLPGLAEALQHWQTVQNGDYQEPSNGYANSGYANTNKLIADPYLSPLNTYYSSRDHFQDHSSYQISWRDAMNIHSTE